MGVRGILIDGEELRQVSGLIGYFVTRSGRIFSNRPKNGKGNKPAPLREMKLLNDGAGRYLQFGYARKKKQVHRAVIETFVGACPEGFEVSHIDGNPKNNRLENLEYVTHKQNEFMKKLHGTDNRGERNVNAKLTEEQVKKIRKILAENKAIGVAHKLANFYGVSEACISNVKHRVRWKEF